MEINKYTPYAEDSESLALRIEKYLHDEKGWKITKQRRIILHAICTQKSIDNIEAFWISIRNRHPISLACITSNIRSLVSERLLDRQEIRRTAIYQLTNFPTQ